MSIESRKEVVERLRGRYLRAGLTYREKLIDQLHEVCGYERKYAIKVLNGNRPGPRGLQQGGARRLYTEAEMEVVQAIWALADYPCGKRLVSILPLWIRSYERRQGPVGEASREKVLSMSAATLDRLLAQARTRVPSRRGSTKSGRWLRSQIPVRGGSWNVDRPGYLEADSVDHGGSSTAGSYMFSITYTDIYSGWVEQAAVWNKGATGVLGRTRQIESDLPFPILGFDADNGGEFLNHHLWRYFTTRVKPVEFTRSREYHKNDNAHVEQKNWTKVRQLLGYARYDQPELVDVVHDLYRNEWRLLQNFFQPVMKLIEKRREGPKVHKRYDVAQTPAQRLLAWKGLSSDKRRWLLHMQSVLDPIELTEAIHRKLKRIRSILQEAKKREAA